VDQVCCLTTVGNLKRKWTLCINEEDVDGEAVLLVKGL
jgi:hypothetical protein